MHKRHNAQRQHIIQSLDALLYQLHTLSFFLSPSIFVFACRIVAQFQCSKPRDVDATRSLRFFFSAVLFFNTPSLWIHATQNAAEGRAVILDFVGLAYVPSKSQIFALDFLIISLQLVLTTIAYETSVTRSSTGSDSQDMLLPIPTSPIIPLSPSTASPLSMPISERSISDHTKYPPRDTSEYVVDLRLAPILARLRNPPPSMPTNSEDSLLPLPNTTPWPLPAGMRMLMRASAQTRRDAGGTMRGEGRIPGGIDNRDV